MEGSLICVGTGMTLGAHISPVSRHYIENADKVYYLMSNTLVEHWVESMNDNCESLQQFYEEGYSRNNSYNDMVAAILASVRAGKKVVAAFYGHPGVFACVAHRAIDKAKKEQFEAHMEAGISAEDCLYADLGIDPGRYGCANFEASQFMFYQRKIDTSAYLILWQVGIAGDQSLTKYSTGASYRNILVELLAEDYPLDHQVILYQAKVLPTDLGLKQQLTIQDLIETEVSMQSTLVIPPTEKLKLNQKIIDKLNKLDNQPLLSLV